MIRYSFYYFIFLSIFQNEYLAQNEFAVDETKVRETNYPYTLKKWNKMEMRSTNSWTFREGGSIYSADGGTLRYIKLEDNSEYLQLYKTAWILESPRDPNSRVRECAVDEPIGLLLRTKAKVAIPTDREVMIRASEDDIIAYFLEFKTANEATRFTYFFYNFAISTQ